ncbi:hypothetical protein SC171_21830 [Pantoea cypripedii]|uniref:hypothetical protein n=1 Tax=Pantoea cypripedii TaxID=55209 RepID=UPI002FCB48C6
MTLISTIPSIPSQPSIAHTSCSYQDSIDFITVDNSSEVISSSGSDNESSLRNTPWTAAKFVSFIRNILPNHIILQIGPQLHNALTGWDLKFTLTAVGSLYNLLLFPFHAETGSVIETGINKVKAYMLAVNQIGADLNWQKSELNYIRQQLARIEIDIPFGNTGVQHTMGLELGITDTSKGFRDFMQHGMPDFSKICGEFITLITADFADNKNLINILIGIIVVGESLSRCFEPHAGRERTLWFGLSLGIDYNGTILQSLPTSIDSEHGSVNIQDTCYIRNSQAMTYDFRTKEYSYPPGFIKFVKIVYKGCKKLLASDILSARSKITEQAIEGKLSTQKAEDSLKALDKLARDLEVCITGPENNNSPTEKNNHDIDEMSVL